MAQSNVFFFVPNLIGYARAGLAVLSYILIADPLCFLPLYALSCILDAADGYAARRLNQSSRFGAVFDMVIDRSTTAGLLCYLCVIYPHWTVAFQLLVGLDLSSHYMHMYSSLSSGSTSHKNIAKSGNVFLRLYYTYRVVMFLACALNEIFFLSLYMMHHFPGAVGKACLVGDIEELVGRVGGVSLNVAQAVALGSFPVWLFKQAMNVVQMVSAAQQLVALERQSSFGSKIKSR